MRYHFLNQTKLNYKVVKYHPQYASQWNDFVQISANATFLHHRDYMDYHADRFADFSLLIFKDKKMVALLPAHQIDKQVFSHKGLTYGDVLFLPNFRIAYKLEVHDALLNYLDSVGIEKISIKMTPFFFTNGNDEANLYIYHKLQADLVEIKPFFVLDTKKEIVLNHDRKKNLKKLQKRNFVLSDDIENLPDFWQIVTENLAVKHQSKPVHSLEEINRLSQVFSDKIKLHTLFLDDEMVSGTLIFLVNNTVHFQYIHSAINAKSRQGVDWLIRQVIDMYKNDYQYISFGSSAKENNSLDAGLAYWKESFGAHIRNQFIYEIDITKKHLLKEILQ